MTELALIAAIQGALGPLPARVLTGSGDDAAVVRADAVAVTSIDTVVEGVHFELATHSPADVGHKALATALSDVTDGVATAAGHLARASDVTLALSLESLPLAAGVEDAEFAASAGDDYELLFTAPPAARAAVERAAAATGTRVTWLGDV